MGRNNVVVVCAGHAAAMTKKKAMAYPASMWARYIDAYLVGLYLDSVDWNHAKVNNTTTSLPAQYHATLTGTLYQGYCHCCGRSPRLSSPFTT